MCDVILLHQDLRRVVKSKMAYLWHSPGRNRLGPRRLLYPGSPRPGHVTVNLGRARIGHNHHDVNLRISEKRRDLCDGNTLVQPPGLAGMIKVRSPYANLSRQPSLIRSEAASSAHGQLRTRSGQHGPLLERHDRVFALHVKSEDWIEPCPLRRRYAPTVLHRVCHGSLQFSDLA